MKKKSTSSPGFFDLRISLAFIFCLAGVFIALGGAGIYLSASKAQAQSGPASMPATANSPHGPDVVPLVGPVCSEQDLRSLPYIPPTPRIEKTRRIPHPFRSSGRPARSKPAAFSHVQSVLEKIFRPAPIMPAPLLTFDGMNAAQVGIEVPPPDTNGDVGPNHYVQSVNQSFRVFDKNGNPLTDPITFNAFFAPIGAGNPCGAKQNKGDPFVLYDQLADRWVITDLAEDPGVSFWECIGVSQTSDPTGAYCLYALQDNPEHPDRDGDYPKFGLWPDAYYLTMNEYVGEDFVAVRVYALDRASMTSGGPTNAVGFTIDPMGLEDSTSLVAASFRTGNPPPAGEQEFLLAIDTEGGDPLTEVNGWLFHVDFAVPENSTLGVGADHEPNTLITVNGFINAFTGTEGVFLVPQQGATQKLDTQGDRIMTPVVYQNRGGMESLWAAHTILLQYPGGPTAIRWYQLDVSGGNFPTTPVQQQDWSNGNDGLWRWMPSIAVDENGNTAIGYSMSSESMFPGIRYAGRLATDPLNSLGQGEATMTNGGGSQTYQVEGKGRWGDYTMTTVDPVDGISFWHTNEYYVTTSVANWSTRVGKFQFPVGSPTPTPTSRPTPIPRPRPTPAPRPGPP